MAKEFNSMSSKNEKIGGNIPVVWKSANKRIHGAVVDVTKLLYKERIVAGTPYEFNLAARTAKLFKCWKIKEVTVSEDNTIVALIRTALTPTLRDNTMVMVMPSAVDGTGKAALCGTVTEKENYTYEVTLPTASFDTLAVDGYLVESSASAAGSDKSLYCKPNNITTEDVVVGNLSTALDVSYGVIGIYQTNIPAMPDVVKTAISNGDCKIIWENFNTGDE